MSKEKNTKGKILKDLRFWLIILSLLALFIKK